MIKRDIENKIRFLAEKFPVITLTGTRQCGKSTLLRHSFPDYRYVSLEDADIRQIALEDPRGFLTQYDEKTIIDEAQYAPKLFSYIQTKVDLAEKTGMYILSGSHNFLLMENISQSLAGRTAVLKLTPFSAHELSEAEKLPKKLNQWLFTGGFPRIYDKDIHPSDFFPSYIQTYIERDVRTIKNITDISTFIRFLKLCAARIGQLLNISSLANECGISTPTAQSWLSVLETSYVIYFLRPYYKNFNKRLVKSAKLYFYDTGLVSSLLGLETDEQLSTHYLRGEIFENMIITEQIKKCYNEGKEPNFYFWRDSNQNEVDLLIERQGNLHAIEIKASATLKTDFFRGLRYFQSFSGIANDALSVIYGGDVDFLTSYGKFITWRNIGKF